jgi:RNA polymerase sigma factor (sigma-70 family)
VRANLRYAVLIARGFSRGRLPLEDLIQQANMGLLRAVDRFDPDRGFRFTTYASWWIRHALSRSTADTSRTVRIPVHMQDVALKVNRLVSIYLAQYGREPTLHELADETGFSLDKVKRIRAIGTGATLSLDRPIGEEADGATHLDMLTDEDAPSALDRVELDERKKALAAAIARLPERLARVLRLRFGIGTDDPLTLHEIGDQMDVSRERIRQLEAQAFRAMRAMLREQERPKALRQRPSGITPSGLTPTPTNFAKVAVVAALPTDEKDERIVDDLVAKKIATTTRTLRRRGPLDAGPAEPPPPKSCTCWMAKQGHQHRAKACPVGGSLARAFRTSPERRQGK